MLMSIAALALVTVASAPNAYAGSNVRPGAATKSSAQTIKPCRNNASRGSDSTASAKGH
jgi:hypothetical protein